MANGTPDLGDLVQRGYRFALSLTHDSTKAEDLVQDAWFSTLKASGPFRREYLFTTIRNRFIDRYRQERRFPSSSFDGAMEETAAPPEEHSEDFEDIAASNGAFELALEQLRPEERGVLYLSAVEEFTAQQIAELLHWPRGTVLSLLHRAKGKIRDCMIAES